MKRIKTVKNSIISLILICAIFVSAFAVSTVSTSAASAPKLNLVNPKSSGSFDVVWNIVPNAVKYRIYFGTTGGRGNGWRRFTVLNASSCTKHPNYPSFKFTINSSSLRGRTWYKYGDDQGISTPYLDNKTVYKCQVEALGDGDRHLAWTNVDYAYLAQIKEIKVERQSRVFKYSWDQVDGCDAYCVMVSINNQPYEIFDPDNPMIIYNVIYDQINTNIVYNYTLRVRTCKRISSNRYVYGPWTYKSV